jgi:acyl-CoA synthetase (AMP-forming)/AMP-acid ligase II
MSTGGTTSTPVAALLGRRVDDAISRHADAVALRTGDETISYRALGAAVDRAAGVLAQHGVGRGTLVALSAGSSLELVAAVFAMARLGAVPVMISTAWREREVAHALELVHPTHLVHDGSGAAGIASMLPVSIHVDSFGVRSGATASPPARPVDEVSPDDLAVVFFSSGTTGLPKAVRHTHRSLSCAIDHWVESLALTAQDRLQIATPPFHILGLLNLYAIAVQGASVRLHRRFDVEAVVGAIERDRITIEMAVAPIALAIANLADLERRDLSSLRYIMWGATPVSPAVAATVTRRSGVRFLPAYGASELPVIAANPVARPEAWRLDSVGVPPRGVEVRIVDLATGSVVPPGIPGEIQVRSPSVMAGYLPEAANGEAFVDGWYRTGDVGTLDGDGWVCITGRVKEMIKVNGFQVAPAEIESVLIAQPDVVDCAVFGVPSATTGEAIVAAVVLCPGASVDLERLVDAVGDQLASYKRISEVVVIDEVPRLASGKVLRRELQASHGT